MFLCTYVKKYTQGLADPAPTELMLQVTFVPLRLRHLPYRGGNKFSRCWELLHRKRSPSSINRGGVGVRQSREGVRREEELEYRTALSRSGEGYKHCHPLDLQSKNKGREIIPTFVSVNQRREVNYVSY